MSNLQEYLKHVEGVTGYRRDLARVRQFTGNTPTLFGSQALGKYVQATPPAKINVGIHSAAGLVAGGLIGAKYNHWTLGAISGFSLFTNTPAVLKTETRREAFWNLAQTHAGVLASWGAEANASASKKVLRFALGYLAVGAVRYVYGGGQ